MNIGFSKLSKQEKINYILSELNCSDKVALVDTEYKEKKLQKRFENFSENTIANFHLPYGVAPHFLIDGKKYTIPMVTEESSVVAAAAKAAKFWAGHGGFKTQIKSVTKVGHIYCSFDLDKRILFKVFEDSKEILLNNTRELTQNMDERGGGIESIRMKTLTDLSNTFKIELKVQTCDAMGANFINSILEQIADSFNSIMVENYFENHFEIIFSILSNYTPECVVTSEVCLEIADFDIDGMKAADFLNKFKKAIDIAHFDTDRAVTHNKGIMNGIDSLILATGNDFRAIEACAHAYAAKDGQYRSLTRASIIDGLFKFSIELPISVGTIGGLTKLHPLASLSLDLLAQPNAQELMRIIACLGLAQNFSAVRSLITTGIQQGHMKMHLLNILAQFDASDEQIKAAKVYFSNKVVSFAEVRSFLIEDSH
mgnify:CR=1 FL=1